MNKPHNTLAVAIGLCYAASFAMPAVMLRDDETMFGWLAFAYALPTVFPVWLANPFFLFGLFSLAMQNWRGATIWGLLSCPCIAFGLFLIFFVGGAPHVGFFFWAGSCVALALVRWIAESWWPGIDFNSERPEDIE